MVWRGLTWGVVVVAVVALLSSRLPFVGIDNAATVHDLYLSRYARFFPDTERLEAQRQTFFAQPYARGYGYGGAIEQIALTELERFAGEVYADYTGAGVYQAQAQLGAVYAELQHTAYGNAHSKNPSSSNTERVVSAVRSLVLRHFNVTAAEYSVIFTSGATGALKLVAESFPWTNASRFVYLRQNHNSVLGIREVALDRGADFVAVPEAEITDSACNVLTTKPSAACLARQQSGQTSNTHHATLTRFPEGTHHLFAFPAMDNFAGVKYPLSWIDKFHAASGEGAGRWLVLLDAAAYVPTAPLNLHAHPDRKSVV